MWGIPVLYLPRQSKQKILIKTNFHISIPHQTQLKTPHRAKVTINYGFGGSFHAMMLHVLLSEFQKEISLSGYGQNT